MITFRGIKKKVQRQVRDYLYREAREKVRKLPPGTTYAIAAIVVEKSKHRRHKQK